MSGSKHFAQLAQKLLKDSDKGLRERQQRWHAKKLMEQLKIMDIEGPADESADDKEAEGADEDKKPKIANPKFDVTCACEARCHFTVILANYSRAIWIAYEEYELLHACYADLFGKTRRPSMERKIKEYWKTFVANPNPAAPHRHAELLLHRCRVERDAHYKEKASLPFEPMAPLRRSIFSRLLDPFSYARCMCLHCKHLDALMDYRVALFKLLKEYVDLFEDYARLFWCSSALLSSSGQEVIVKASEMDLKMLDKMLGELYTATSFKGQNTNVMENLQFLHNLIYR